MKKFCLIAMSLIFAFCSFGCYACGKDGGYKHPKYKSEYTEEEHRERIATRTREKYADLLADGSITFEVYTVYAFYDNDPEYFLIEFSGEKDGKEYNAHMLGYIVNDRYFQGIYGYDHNVDFPNPGKSFWSTNNVLNLKKYYGGRVHGYEKDGIIYGSELEQDGEFSELREISKSKYEYLMKANFKLFVNGY